ncbi:hypothetical protein A2U01_0118024, partial [Trifolium medium]|nr:hypothetical protein [Trifolium medium]
AVNVHHSDVKRYSVAEYSDRWTETPDLGPIMLEPYSTIGAE